MMEKPEILNPRKGYHFDLSVLALGLFAFAGGLAYIVYDVVFLNGEEAPYVLIGVIIILLILPVVYVRPGRYVVIDGRRGISRPMILRRSDGKLIHPRNIQWYTRVYSISDKEAVIGVIVSTTKGKKTRYSDRKTPGCAMKILKLLEGNQVPERIPKKKHLG